MNMISTLQLIRPSCLLVLAVTLASCAGDATQQSPTLAPTALSATRAPGSTAAGTATFAPTSTAQPADIPHAPPAGLPTSTPTETPTPMPLNPLSIEYMRQQTYPGSKVTLEQTLAPGSNYNRYIASYKSDGFKIYALLTVPNGPKPAGGWPVIIFNHGYIAPAQYRTTERYVAYVDAIARSGYIVFKSDYRGNGSSEGTPGGHFSPAYAVDVLNALASMKKYEGADPSRIGMWGHSMGGEITLRAMVVSRDIKAGVIWAGTVGTYAEQTDIWGHGPAHGSAPAGVSGSVEQNAQIQASISANTYVSDLSGPLQLHHGTADQEVPLKFSQELYDQTQTAGKSVELYTYPGDDHNISTSFNLAMQRSIMFFNKYVKGWLAYQRDLKGGRLEQIARLDAGSVIVMKQMSCLETMLCLIVRGDQQQRANNQ